MLGVHVPREEQNLQGSDVMRHRISRFSGYWSLDAAEEVVAACRNIDEGNMFLEKLCLKIVEYIPPLKAALALGRKGELTTEGDDLDEQFGVSMTTLRNVVKMQAPLAEMGERSTSSQEIWSGLERYGGNLEDLARDVQLKATESFFEEFAVDDPRFVVAGVQIYAKRAYEKHKKLALVENKKVEIADREKSIPTVRSASRKINPLVATLYNHIEAYAKLDDPLYTELLGKLDNRLGPIAVKIKGRESRRRRGE
jgi:hypothetical protein